MKNNRVHSSAMENLRNRVDIRLVMNDKDYQKLVSTPFFVSQKIFDKNLVAAHKIKEVLTLNKPAYVGMCSYIRFK